jgi:hypothetical protein
MGWWGDEEMERWGDFTLSPYLHISLLFFSRETHLASVVAKKGYNGSEAED